MISKVLQAAMLGSVVEAKYKHNGSQDGLLPEFNIFGFTNIDILDFWTGAAERAYGRDVRQEWRRCFKKLSITDSMGRLSDTGYFTFFWQELTKVALRTEDDSVTESVFPPDCKNVADELDGMNLFVRDTYLANIIPIKFWINGLSNMENEAFDVFDIPKRMWEHDYYTLGYDVGDLLLTISYGYSNPASGPVTEPDDYDDNADEDTSQKSQDIDDTTTQPTDDKTTPTTPEETYDPEDYDKSEIEQYRSKLTDDQWRICYQKGDEQPFRNKYWNNH